MTTEAANGSRARERVRRIGAARNGLRLLPLILGLSLTPAAATSDPAAEHPSARFPVPHALAVEHRQLHADLASAVGAGGATGAAAKAVADVLHPHFVKEDRLALPPLALLAPLARGELSADMRDVLVLTDELREEMPRMLDEHRAIVGALDRLSAAARAEDKPAIVEFADRLRHHAENEEAVLYPSAVLVGAYVEAKLGR